MRVQYITVALVLIGAVAGFRIGVPGPRPLCGYSHKRLTREPTPYIHQLSTVAQPNFSFFCAKGVANAAHSPSKFSIQSLFRRLISAISEFLGKFKSPQQHISRGKIIVVQKGPSHSTFISATSTPINKILNLSSGRQYAEAKLQEIDSYFKRVGKAKGSVAGEVNATQLQIQQTYEQKRSVLDLPDEEFKGKRVLLRCNLDVPVQNGTVTEDAPLRYSLPTIQHLVSKGAKVVLAGHRGQPAGQGYEALYTLAPVAISLGELLNQTVTFVPDCTGVVAERAVAGLSEGSVMLLENLRFHAEEVENNADFAKNLTALVDIFVNDDLSSAHLALASTQGIASMVPTAVTGLAVKRDFEAFNITWVHFATPLVAIVSVGNLTAQMPFLEKLVAKPDRVIFTGQLAASLLHAHGNATADNKEELTGHEVDLARRLHQVAADHGTSLDLIPDCKDDTFPGESRFGNGTLLWVGAEESQPDKALLRVTTRQFNHTFSSYENALEMIKGSALPGIMHLNKHEN